MTDEPGEDICTCDEGRETVCHLWGTEPHYAGCPRWGTRNKGCGECTPEGNGPCLADCRIGDAR